LEEEIRLESVSCVSSEKQSEGFFMGNLPFSEICRLAALAVDDVAALCGGCPELVDRAFLEVVRSRLAAAGDGGER